MDIYIYVLCVFYDRFSGRPKHLYALGNIVFVCVCGVHLSGKSVSTREVKRDDKFSPKDPARSMAVHIHILYIWLYGGILICGYYMKTRTVAVEFCVLC